MIGIHFGLYCAGLALVMDDGTGTVRDCTMRGWRPSLFVLTRGIWFTRLPFEARGSPLRKSDHKKSSLMKR